MCTLGALVTVGTNLANSLVICIEGNEVNTPRIHGNRHRVRELFHCLFQTDNGLFPHRVNVPSQRTRFVTDCLMLEAVNVSDLKTAINNSSS